MSQIIEEKAPSLQTPHHSRLDYLLSENKTTIN